jgi:hypothetical protein
VEAASRTPEQQLAWEAERRTYAAATAIGAALAVLGGAIYTAAVAFKDYPQVGLVQAITPALNGQARAAKDPHAAVAQFYDDHTAQLVVGALLSGIGALLMAYVLYYLAEATRARRAEFPALARWLPLVGAALVLIGSVGGQLASASNARKYLEGPQTADAAEQITRHGASAVFGYLVVPGQLALAFAFVFVSLNAMRAGLLTRFMGVLGIIVGALFVIQLGPLPVVQAFWLAALAPLVMLRWPSGTPPAWITGKAEPWPTGEEMRRQRDSAQAHREAQVIKAAPADSEEAAEPVRRAHPSSKKRRKKRR